MTDPATQDQIDSLKVLGAVGIVAGIIGWFTPKNSGATIVQSGSTNTISKHRNQAKPPTLSNVAGVVDAETVVLGSCDRTHSLAFDLNDAVSAGALLFQVDFQAGQEYLAPPQVHIQAHGISARVESFRPSATGLSSYQFRANASMGIGTYNVLVTCIPTTEDYD